MKLKLFQKETIKEEQVAIYYRKMTPLIRHLVEVIEGSNSVLSHGGAQSTFNFEGASSSLSVEGLNEKGEWVIIDARSIFYFESVDKRNFAYLEHEVYQLRDNLNQIENTFTSIGFTRISKANVVNVYKIHNIKPEKDMRITAVMCNGESLTINRTYKKAFRTFLIERRNLK